MPRTKRTRVPPDDGAPANLKPTRADQRETTLRSAIEIFAKLTELELPFREDGWNEAKALVDPNGASWRATYRPHVSHLFAHLRDTAAKGGLGPAEAAALRDRLRRAQQCVKERDAEIVKLKATIAELEAENGKMGRGTRPRRSRRPRHGRQGPTEDGGSD